MMTLEDLIRTARTTLDRTAPDELDQVRALGVALASADEQLIGEVRLMAARHDATRAQVVEELRALAAKIGYLPSPLGAGDSASQSRPPAPMRVPMKNIPPIEQRYAPEQFPSFPRVAQRRVA
jgi:hypothetical protein